MSLNVPLKPVEKNWDCVIVEKAILNNIVYIEFLDVKKWQDYVEPGDELEQGSPMRRTSRNLDEEGGDVLPLGDGVLTRNLGLDVVVVVTKVKGLLLLNTGTLWTWTF